LKWIEGTRAFNVLFGVVSFSVASPTSWRVSPKHRTLFFTPRVDRNQGLQLAHGIFCTSMAFIDPAFFMHRGAAAAR
jgi:hypothetical protein